MRRSLSLITGILCLSMSHCAFSPFTSVHSRMDMEDARIVAVLDFEQQGLGEKLGIFAADELTSALFVNKEVKVADRSHVQSVMQKNGFSGYSLETNDVKQIGKLADADFIILGKLVRLTDAAPIAEIDPKTTIQIVFRILAARDGSVIGIVECKETCKKDLQACIKKMIRKMAERVEIKE